MIHGVSDRGNFSDKHLDMTQPTQPKVAKRRRTLNCTGMCLNGLVLQAGALRITLRIQSPVLTFTHFQSGFSSLELEQVLQSRWLELAQISSSHHFCSILIVLFEWKELPKMVP